MGFHCTGMPIKTAADKLKREIQQYGDPAKPNARPNFPAVVAEGEGGEQLKHKKLQAKSAGKNFQWEVGPSQPALAPRRTLPLMHDARYPCYCPECEGGY